MGSESTVEGVNWTRWKASPRGRDHTPQIIYTAEIETLTDEGLILRLDDVMVDAPHDADGD